MITRKQTCQHYGIIVLIINFIVYLLAIAVLKLSVLSSIFLIFGISLNGGAEFSYLVADIASSNVNSRSSSPL